MEQGDAQRVLREEPQEAPEGASRVQMRPVRRGALSSRQERSKVLGPLLRETERLQHGEEGTALGALGTS